MTVSTILDRLAKVRPTGAGKWTACCPAHKDRTPSLSIRELDDGRVLLHCHAGCGVAEVLGAVGLEFDSLFPARPLDHRQAPIRKPWRASEVIAALKGELMVAFVVLSAVRAGTPVNDDDRERAGVAMDRIALFLSELENAH